MRWSIAPAITDSTQTDRPMSDPAEHPVTLALHAVRRGEKDAGAHLLPLVYEELRGLARARMARESPGQTLQPTALVHEAYLRLVGDAPRDDPGWENRGHFFGAAARAMRQILVEQARRKAGPKAGGGRHRENLDLVAQNLVKPAADGPTPPIDLPSGAHEDMVGLDAALSRLEREDARKAEVVMLKYFAGLEHEQIAQVLDISVPTVERDWRFARAWLKKELRPAAHGEGEQP